MKQRIISVLLASLLFIGCLPGAAFAADDVDIKDPPSQTEELPGPESTPSEVTSKPDEPVTSTPESKPTESTAEQTPPDKTNQTEADHSSQTEEQPKEPEQANQKQRMLKNAKSGSTADDPLAVPAEGMIIQGSTYYGVSKEWFVAQNPEQKTLYLSVTIPSNVTTIANDGFRDSYSPDKTNYGAVTSNDGVGNYHIVSLDFSKADKLTTIGNQACMRNTYLSGELKLPASLKTLGKSAFSGCSGLTGVVLPAGLKELGSTDAGSVFKECTGLQYVRTAGGNASAAFELPASLQILGKHSFYKCTGLPAGTTATIPVSVTYMGSEVFHYTPAITTIRVLAADASGYDGGAFKGSSYGLGTRLTVFQNAASKKSFTPSGSNSYANSLTYEFTLHYGTHDGAKTESKLYGQALNVCKTDSGWSVNGSYTLPEVGEEEVPAGFTGVWAYNNALLTPKTILKPDGDDLYLDVQAVIQQPTVEFIVDGKTITAENTYPKLNLTNDSEHTIGVSVSHPLLDAQDADVQVKFEYEWTDVWKGGSEGPRMSEDGFGRYNLFDNPKVTNTITINGAAHERTSAGNYSGEDYGDGYYLLEIYGYQKQKTDGQWKLFYKSASTVIDSDPDRTTNTAYLFDVVTSDPAVAPECSVEDVTVDYGYDSASFTAAVKKEDDCTYTYQWYEASSDGQTTGGTKIDGAESDTYSIPIGKDAGTYHYYLEVTATAANGDAKTTAVAATLTVNPKTVSVVPTDGQKKYTGQSDPTFQYTLSGADDPLTVTGALSRKAGEDAGSYAYTIGTLKTDNKNYHLVLSSDASTFTIKPYQSEATFSPASPDGKNGWYRSNVTVTPPKGHAISIDEGKTWSTDPIVLKDSSDKFSYWLKSELDDDTKGAIAKNEKSLSIDTTAPVVTGIENDHTYCISVKFKVKDDHLDQVTADGKVLKPKNGSYTLTAGKHTIVVTDLAGNSVTLNVRVNQKHMFETVTDQGSKYEQCKICGYKQEAAAKPEAKSNSPKTGDSSNLVLWVLLLTVSGSGLAGITWYKKKNRHSN